ncbi:MAG: DEAD/DEAH box helicase [Ilumatobacteraceae bacterium]
MAGEYRQGFVDRYPFDLDGFQLEALDAFEDGQHVIVAAPTGSGKTVVAEYGVEVMLRSGRRAFCTAPIKALSNQKYRDLVALHGDDAVGLLTGDTVINGDAPVVVMTTEVLRNMIYAGRDLSDLGAVVLDEVHFLQDAYRGPVWEEVIIHLPAHVQLVCLSATVSNARDLGEWITTVRGPTHVVVELRRPVELDQFYFVADRTHSRLRLMPTLVDGQPNRDALRIDASGVRFGGRRRDRTPRGSGERKLATPSREEVVSTLDERRLLPAIYFIFSRAQCDEAARTLVDSGVSFSDPEHQQRIREIAADRLAGLHDDDLEVLGYEQFLRQLDAGVAAHHAGLVPPFKEVVEQAFVEGLLQVVFATETLAVGVNMPARSVVIEKLTKYTGDGHETLSPGQFTQLTGRAGRRGIDDRGAAVVLWSPFVRFDDVAELAASRSFHLRSAFRPTFNMVANLVRTYDHDRARQLLTLSFAQHQADRDIVRIERRLQKQRDRLADLRREAVSPFGDIDEYRRTHTADGTARGPIDDSLALLRPGEVIHVDKGKHFGPAAVVATASRAGGVKVTAVTPSGHALTLTASDFDAPVVSMGDVVLPGNYSPNRKDYRQEVGRRLKRAKLRGGRPRPSRSPGPERHPVEDDPDLRQRLEAAKRADRTAEEIESLERRADQRNASLGREFDAVLEILDQRGYVELDAWRLTERGVALSNLFHESDLLVCEALGAGLFDGLDPAQLAGLVSCVVYEHRSPDDPPRPWFPNDDVRDRCERLEEISRRLAADQRRHGLAEHRPPDPGFVAIAYAWVGGEAFADIVGDEELTGGDFVRTTKQLVDLLGQIAHVATDPATRAAARSAAESARRGVVADSSVVEP